MTTRAGRREIATKRSPGRERTTGSATRATPVAFGMQALTSRRLSKHLLSDDNFATLVGLRPVEPDEPGIRRLKWGEGFTYRWPDDATVVGRERERCESLAIPPAWADVWICTDALGHLQARGRDDAGRVQYRYHDRWIEARRAANFDRLLEVGSRLKGVRKKLVDDLEGDDTALRALAAMLRLVDQSFARIGNEASTEEHGTRGISTLEGRHVTVADPATLELSFIAKGSTEYECVVSDTYLAEAITELENEGGRRLFSIEVDGDRTTLTARDANQRLSQLSSGALSCKDFRTWGGSAVALEARVLGETGTAAIDAAARALHNTRAVARSTYVHPMVVEADENAVDRSWRSSRRSKWYARRERALLALLDSVPPLLEAYLV